MSEIRDSISDSIQERLAYTGETVTNLRTSKTFIAEYEVQSDLELSEAMGRDPREQAILHVSDTLAADGINVNDVLQINFYGTASKFKVLQKRTNNPGSSQVEFSLMRLVSGKDQQ